jgi:hypothetical protein
MNIAVFWVVAPWAIALTMEISKTYETSVNFYRTTRRNIPEDSHMHTLTVMHLILSLGVFKFEPRMQKQTALTRC